MKIKWGYFSHSTNYNLLIVLKCMAKILSNESEAKLNQAYPLQDFWSQILRSF